MSKQPELRQRFNEAARFYDEVRPQCPREVVDEVVNRADLCAGAMILEIGCGTGQATIPFAERNYNITAIEPGNALAAIAIEKCRSYPRVRVLQTTFEEWAMEEQAFDLVLSVQAFHWIPPEYGIEKVATALRTNGALALVWHLDLSQNTSFWQKTQPIYEAYCLPSAANRTASSLEEQMKSYKQLLADSKFFGSIQEVRHSWRRTYTGADYLKLLNTYSDHRALSELAKSRFCEEITDAIEAIGGNVQREYETVLLLALRQ